MLLYLNLNSKINSPIFFHLTDTSVFYLPLYIKTPKFDEAVLLADLPGASVAYDRFLKYL